MTDLNPGAPLSPPTRQPRQTTSLLGRFFVLLFSAVLLLVFIAGLGDWRRRHNVYALLSIQARSYDHRVSDSRLLPLNLEPPRPPDPQNRILDRWLSEQEARVLRTVAERVMVAWTVPVVQVLGENDRGVIFFQDGRFEVDWVSPRKFDALHAQQAALARRLESGSSPASGGL